MKIITPRIEVLTGTGNLYIHPQTGLEAKNPFVIEADTVRVLMRGGQFAVIDLADFAAAAQYRWSPDRGYAQTAIRVGGKQVKIRLHRLLMGAAADGKYVDHINGQRWDCRRQNLRACTPRQNVLNRAVNVSNQIGYRGVRVNKATGLYFVQIKQRGQQYRVGKFLTPQEAARGYDFLSRAFFGEFGRLNFPDQAG